MIKIVMDAQLVFIRAFVDNLYYFIFSNSAFKFGIDSA